MKFKKLAYSTLCGMILTSLSMYTMEETTQTNREISNELWIDKLRKLDPLLALTIMHFVQLNPSLAFCLHLKQSDVEDFFHDHPEIMKMILQLNQRQNLPNDIANVEAKTKLTL